MARYKLYQVWPLKFKDMQGSTRIQMNAFQQDRDYSLLVPMNMKSPATQTPKHAGIGYNGSRKKYTITRKNGILNIAGYWYW